MFILLVSNREKILSIVTVVVWGQVKSEKSSLPVTVCISKTRVLKLPNDISWQPAKNQPWEKSLQIQAKSSDFILNPEHKIQF